MLFALASVPLVAPCREENNHHNNAATEVETIAIGKFKERMHTDVHFTYCRSSSFAASFSFSLLLWRFYAFFTSSTSLLT